MALGRTFVTTHVIATDFDPWWEHPKRGVLQSEHLWNCLAWAEFRIANCAVDHLDLMSVSHTAKSRIAVESRAVNVWKLPWAKECQSGSMKIGRRLSLSEGAQKKHADMQSYSIPLFFVLQILVPWYASCRTEKRLKHLAPPKKHNGLSYDMGIWTNILHKLFWHNLRMVEVSKAWHLLRTGCLPIILILLSM